MKKITYTILCAILMIILLVNIFSSLGSSFLGFRVYRIGSGSMEPTLKVNSFVLIKKSDKYEIDDIVTYKKNNEYITHRIIEINNNEIIAKGDANNTADDPINKNTIVGKVIFNLNVINFINYLFNKPLTWILLFIIGLIITILIPDKKIKVNT